MNAVVEAMVNSVILSAALGALVWLVLRATPRRRLNAATRYGTWWVAMAVVVLLPLSGVPMPEWRPAPAVTVSPVVSAGQVSAAAEPIAVPMFSPPAIDLAGPAVLTSGPAEPARISLPLRVPAGRWTGWILAACATAGLLMLLRLFVSYWMLLRRRLEAVRAPDDLARRVPVWLCRCGSRRAGVRLAIDHRASTPFVFGPYRPAIILPAHLVESLEPAELDQVGLHEAAHLARRDDCALLLQRVVEAVFGWNPVVRWIGRQIELEREIACDDFVIAVTGHARPYAACLTRIAESACAAPSLAAVGASGGAGQLIRRVELLLDRTRHCGTRVLKGHMGAAVALVAGLALLATQATGPIALATPFEPPPLQAPAAPQAPGQTVERVVKASPVAPDPIRKWIASSAVRLKTAEARHGFADMQPLKKMIGAARIVSLGEATHGTREFFQLKHRMLEFLATEMGFTIFSIEANMPEAYRLNEYVLEGKGDPAKLLAGMYFWTWNTEEVLDMIRWMREFNQSGKGRVQFTGFDMQYPDVAMANVREFVAKHDARYAEDLTKASSLASGARSQQQRGLQTSGATGSFPVKDAAGKRVRFSGYIRTENVMDGDAGLWWRVDGPGRQMLAFANLQDAAPRGTTGWKRYSLEVDVARNAENIIFGLLLSGSGAAWFDGLTVELDGKPYTSDTFDFGFEAQAVKGLFSYGNASLDREGAHSGQQSLRVKLDKAATQNQVRFGYATAQFPVEDARGKKVRFSGYIRTENVTDGYAGLWWRVDGSGRKPIAFTNLKEDAPKGTTDWRRYSVEIDVDPAAENISFGILSSGGGSAWFDGLTVELDGKPYTSDVFDFDFESVSVKGFMTGAFPWSVALERDVVRSGKQSLRIRRDGPAPPPQTAVQRSTTDFAVATRAAEAWNEVARHLDGARASYAARKVSVREIEWAIRNARVVEQCMLSRANRVPRDRSMAENVKWILDQNPGAKIVLWAHNGHVATGGYRGYEPMGADLRRTYGDQMFVFGFAFNQGSFQAVEQGRGLRDFTVPPSPDGSLDATFAAAGIPIFAIDLLRAPVSGPVAEWLDQPHKTRSIGAGYSEANAGLFFSELPRHAFDGMLFVDKTTAARKNPAVP